MKNSNDDIVILIHIVILKWCDLFLAYLAYIEHKVKGNLRNFLGKIHIVFAWYISEKWDDKKVNTFIASSKSRWNTLEIHWNRRQKCWMHVFIATKWRCDANNSFECLYLVFYLTVPLLVDACMIVSVCCACRRFHRWVFRLLSRVCFTIKQIHTQNMLNATYKYECYDEAQIFDGCKEMKKLPLTNAKENGRNANENTKLLFEYQLLLSLSRFQMIMNILIRNFFSIYSGIFGSN